jgi:redox-sensing transcriptional repressor
MVSDRTIGRLSLYRRLLNVLQEEGVRNVFSHQLAQLTGRSAAQVRRDLMAVGYSGSPMHGYEVGGLLKSLRDFLDKPGGQNAALVGVGNLGKALLAYFTGRRPNLHITAAFDNDPYKVNRVIHGCPCHPLEEAAEVLRAKGIQVAIVAVPAAAAQAAAELVVEHGVRGILNFAPVRLKLPPHVYVEDIDMTMSLEKVAYFARQGDAARQKEPAR